MADRLTRRTALSLAAAGAFLAAGCRDDSWHSIVLNGALPRLAFEMTRARDGKLVTQVDYAGRPVLLFFGYTHCEDVCPLTIGYLAQVMGLVGPKAQDTAVLFVTVDPNRDTLPVLNRFLDSLDPQFDALRGTPDQLARLARRYRVTYKVTPATATAPYSVQHGPSVYIFDRKGTARLMVPKLYDSTADLAGVAADITRLAAEKA